jgi:hypothetical protein
MSTTCAIIAISSASVGACLGFLTAALFHTGADHEHG